VDCRPNDRIDRRAQSGTVEASEIKAQGGNPAFLEQVYHGIQLEAKLTGTEAPTKQRADGELPLSMIPARLIAARQGLVAETARDPYIICAGGTHSRRPLPAIESPRAAPIGAAPSALGQFSFVIGDRPLVPTGVATPIHRDRFALQGDLGPHATAHLTTRTPLRQSYPQGRGITERHRASHASTHCASCAGSHSEPAHAVSEASTPHGCRPGHARGDRHHSFGDPRCLRDGATDDAHSPDSARQTYFNRCANRPVRS